ncbi:MAG: ATP-binding cassette domain-containing protein [Candidatus Aminicenantes bacterium]|nr:ATP-binding cassette domain-containing protein [Candidatus Aminicenantes bacterium]
MNIIEARQLNIGYGEIPVLNGLDFSIPEGRITVILGKSGSGKTTLLKSLIGLLPPFSGEIRFCGEPLDFSSEKSLQAHFRRIGVLFQNGALLSSLSLFENIALPLRIHQPELRESEIQDRIAKRLSQVGLEQSGDKYPGELSGGMRKRAGLARALIQDPKIVFCDEPSAGLDPITSTQLDRLMLRLNRDTGTTLAVVTHELRSVEAVADRVLVLHDSRVHFDGEFEELKTLKDPFIESFFLRTT